jgi:xanthine dehydrogenase YagR molybdenum-binding subunit
VLDPRDGRVVNASLSDYLVPVNLDIGTLDVEFVEEEDPYVNPLGVKGLGEIALVGVAAAVANAVYHASGWRVRNLPIRIATLLQASHTESAESIAVAPIAVKRAPLHRNW